MRKRRRKDSFWEILGWSVAAAAFVTAVVLFRELTGYEGRHYGFSRRPKAFREAWELVPLVAGSLFFSTFLLLSVWSVIRRLRRSAGKTGAPAAGDRGRGDL